MNQLLFGFVAGVIGMPLSSFTSKAGWIGILLLPILWRLGGLRLLAALVVGFLWSYLHASLYASALLPRSLEGKDLILTGSISSLPIQQAKVTRFEMRVDRLEPIAQGVPPPRRVRLSWYGMDRRLTPGEVWRLQVRLKRPRGFQNPGGFDYERWLFGHAIQAIGYVKAASVNQRPTPAYHGGWIDRWRQAISSQLERRVADPDAAALLRALAIGDRSGLSDASWQTFTRTGTNHLVAISGLHIGMVAGLMFFLGQWLWRRSERLTLVLPARRAAAWLALAAAFGYAALAGFSLPTQRALLMLVLGLGAVLSGRRLTLGRSLSLALFGVVLIDPMAPLSSGFWLSFGAVAIILFAMGGRLQQTGLWWRWGRVQWAIALGLAPLLFLLFNQASIVAPLVNLILVPWFSLVLVPLVLLSVTTLPLSLPHDILVQTSASLAEQTLALLQWAGQSPQALAYRPDLPFWSWFLALPGVALLLLPKGLPGRPLGLLMIVPMLCNSPQRPQSGEALFTLLDVGQGLSGVVETAGHVLVYDTGPAYASGFNTASAVVLPYLRSRGIARIDRLVVSNADRDHAGGIQVLQREIPIVSILSGETLGPIATERCRAGQAWQWDGVAFRILHPGSEDRFHNSNDASCVLQVETAEDRLLIPGDVEQEAERLLVERYAQTLRSDILVAPHHGSNTSSSQTFVASTQPAYVLFPTGYRNRFGFPKAAVMARWEGAGATLLNNAETGAIQFWLGSAQHELQPLLYREDHPALWRSSGAPP